MAGAASEAFPKARRLRRRPEFLKVQERGLKVSADSLTALVLPAAGPTRVGLTVSSKVGNAVVRNRVRRRLRELCRKRMASWPAGLEIVLIARPSASNASSQVLERSISNVERVLAMRFGRS